MPQVAPVLAVVASAAAVAGTAYSIYKSENPGTNPSNGLAYFTGSNTSTGSSPELARMNELQILLAQQSANQVSQAETAQANALYQQEETSKVWFNWVLTGVIVLVAFMIIRKKHLL